MDQGTRRERVIQAIRASSRPLDDDQLAIRTGISPRQSVNQVYRELEQSGLIRRQTGPDSKIVNEWLGHQQPAGEGRRQPAPDPDEQHLVVPEVAADEKIPPGSSAEQRAAERVMLDLLGGELGLELNPVRISVPSGERVEVDGADASRKVLVECWAHQGAPKIAQRHKVINDAFKLTWIATTLYPKPHLILCLSDPQAAAPFLPSARSWAARAIQDFGITIKVVALPAEVRQSVLDAQRRQFR